MQRHAEHIRSSKIPSSIMNSPDLHSTERDPWSAMSQWLSVCPDPRRRFIKNANIRNALTATRGSESKRGREGRGGGLKCQWRDEWCDLCRQEIGTWHFAVYPWLLRRRITRVCSTHVVCAGATGNVLRRCFHGTMDCRPVQWVYVLDSGQWSSVTVKPHHPGCLTVGRVASRRVVSVRRMTTKGGSNPPVFPVTRADVYPRTLIAHRFVHIIYPRAWIYIVRHVIYARV